MQAHRFTQTHSVRFSRPLVSASVKGPESSSDCNSAAADHPMVNAGESASNLIDHADRHEKLTVTQSTDAATSPLTNEMSHETDRTIALLERIERQLQEQNRSTAQWLSQFQELTISTSLAIAEAVVKYEVDHHQDRIKQLLSQLMEEDEWQQPAVIYLHSSDLEKLDPVWQASTLGKGQFQFKKDDSIDVGDCRIETANKSLSANLQRQLSEIQIQLRERLSHVGPHTGEMETSN